MTIKDAVISNYGQRLSVRLSDGRTLRFSVASLIEHAPVPDTLRVETLERDRDSLIRQLQLGRKPLPSWLSY